MMGSQTEGSPPQSVIASVAAPAGVTGAGDELSSEELESTPCRPIMELMREAVQQDGGDLVLVGADYATGVVDVELQGACGSCAISAMTLVRALTAC